MLFAFDIETVGVASDSGILSAALVYCDPELLHEDNTEAYHQLISQSCFVKFDIKEQINNPDRKKLRSMDSGTLTWWKKQGEIQQKASLIPDKDTDVSVWDGMKKLGAFFDYHRKGKDSNIWLRGSLDQLATESICNAYEVPNFVIYNHTREVRTALDILYPEFVKNGYVEVPDFDVSNVVKHHPVHDSAYDLLMLFRGRQV